MMLNIQNKTWTGNRSVKNRQFLVHTQIYEIYIPSTPSVGFSRLEGL